MDDENDMEGSDHDNDDDEEDDDDEEEGMGGIPGSSAFARFNELAAEAGMHIDEGTAAALFGSGFRSMGSMMSGLNNRFKRLRNDLKSKNVSTRLAALRECSEVLLVSNEDTLGGSFSTQGFATEFIAILKGTPNIDESSTEAGPSYAMDIDEDEDDEDAQLARALAMSTEGAMPPGMGMDASEEEMECQLVACRCLAHLLEALPGTGHTLVHLGAVPVLCSKLNEPSYIELAEQTLSVSRACKQS
jgi:E3 ubiquitin-protein ligase TRIP12